MNDILTGCDRIANTPIPIAYSIAISQITWTYILILPFQVYEKLKVITIPATLLAAYIILGLSMIGSQIENPFGLGVNDLPLETFCRQIAADVDIISSAPAPKTENFVKNALNLPLFPLSWGGYKSWAARNDEDIRDALKAKVTAQSEDRKDVDEHRRESSSEEPGAQV
jgi:ion channel-forming bestrophin family protein